MCNHLQSFVLIHSRNVDAAIVVVDMNDEDSIELAGAWRQDFLNKTTKCKLVNDKLPNGSKVI